MLSPVLLVSDGWVHPSLFARLQLERLFSPSADLAFRRACSLNDLGPADDAGVRAVVLYYHHKQIRSKSLAAFAGFTAPSGIQPTGRISGSRPV